MGTYFCPFCFRYIEHFAKSFVTLCFETSLTLHYKTNNYLSDSFSFCFVFYLLLCCLVLVNRMCSSAGSCVYIPSVLRFRVSFVCVVCECVLCVCCNFFVSVTLHKRKWKALFTLKSSLFFLHSFALFSEALCSH